MISLALNRRRFGGVVATATTVALFRPWDLRAAWDPWRASGYRVKPFELDELSVRQLQGGMESGRFTALSLTRKYLGRIEKLDKAGPAINAVIEINPDALDIARSLDNERKSRGPRGPLHGVPVLLKDNLDTCDRMMTTAGSLALLGSIAKRDAFVVQRLRQAGAVILGKTNLSEWANFRSSRSTSGWSGRGGQTRNPYVLDRNPSGSSSGSAVAVAANLCALAVGTETDGSILSPSSYTGIVGIKPTVGLVSRSGIIPIALSQDTAGPMARTVTDAAILLGAMTGVDQRDETTAQSTGKFHRDYTPFLDPRGLRGARLGIARKFFRLHKDAVRLIDSAVAEMKRLGAILVDPADLATHDQLDEVEFEVLLYEFKTGLQEYLADVGPKVSIRTLKDVIEFNERNRQQEMPFFGQETFLRAEAKGPLSEPAYLEALANCRRLSRTEGIDAVMDTHRLDAIIAPTTGPAHVTDFVHGDRSTGGSSSPAAVAGYPSVTVPTGFVSGLPVGISFFGRAFSEPLLIKLAFAFEQATKFRKPPGFLPTVGYDA
jgi:amidase